MIFNGGMPALHKIMLLQARSATTVDWFAYLPVIPGTLAFAAIDVY